MPSGQRNNGPSPMVPMMMQSFDTMFQTLMEPNPRGYRGYGDDPFHAQSSTSPDWLEDDHLTGHHPGLSPRNADGPQPNNRNPTDLAEIMEAIRADIGLQTTRRGRGARGPASPHALSILSAILNMSRSDDAVYSQEELDRVITQLIENTGGTSTAAPPASDAAVQALPRKKVNEEMMGAEGKAVCSICMDNVELGLEVTVLPCTHWFHFNCIHAWLTQHDTCPHCRRSINSNVAGGEGTCENPFFSHCAQRSILAIFIPEPTFPTNFTASVPYARGGAYQQSTV
ncbi:Zinc finger, RING-type [Penicillium griseofulvum]|uniref:RING-type E3 ubiquitin transferase n=1 Tax=Penicillium patulum TaxID=5078 RepID=A0A135LH75_PENPA|nr:Zinc finger, RING-type [Penicillium griseofulvum]KXG48331.1 Zinc finger, RING-type [Penicillium griseofulvum]